MRAPFLLPLVTTAALLALAGSAHADDPALPPPPPVQDVEPAVTPTERAETPPASPPLTASGTAKHWYGWETLLADSASVVVFALGANASDSRQAPFLGGGLVSYALAPPIIHTAHGRWGIAGADVGVRVGALLVGSISGAFLGASFGSGSSNQWGGTTIEGTESGLLIGATLGALTASVIDAAVFAREKVKPEETDTAAFRWSPSVRPVRDGMVAGIGGTF